MMIGTCAVALSRLSLRQTSIPLVPSIIQSRMTRSGVSSAAYRSASSPSPVTRTLYPSFSNRYSSSSARARSSSTSSSLGAVTMRLFRPVSCYTRVTSDASLVGRQSAERSKVDHFSDVSRMVANPLDIARHEQQLRRRADRGRVLDHVADEIAENAVVERIDLV